MVIGLDNTVISVESREEFFNILESRKAKFKEVAFNDLAFVSIEKAKKKYETNLAAVMGIEEDELVKDTEINTGMILVDVPNKKPYLVGTSSWLSIYNQYKINGIGFRELCLKTRMACFNELNSSSFLQSKKALLVIIDNKIRAIMTAGTDGRTYTHMPPTELFSNFEKAMLEKDIDFSFTIGIYDYESIAARYRAKDKAVGDLYNAAGYIPEVLIVTSETGYSSTKLIPVLQHQKTKARIVLENEAIILEHKGSNTIDKLKKKLPLLFLKQQKFIEVINHFMTIEVSYPYDTINRICKNIGFSKKNTKILKENFAEYISASTSSVDINMYDIFQVFLELDSSFKDKTEYEKTLGKILTINIDKMLRDVKEEKEDDVLF